MPTIIFWIVMIVIAWYVFYKMNDEAGCKNINGKWVKTMHTDHFTIALYWMVALLIVFAIYVIAGFLICISGLDCKLVIYTGFRKLVSCF